MRSPAKRTIRTVRPADRVLLAVLVLVLTQVPWAAAQQTQEPLGIESGNYTIRQSFEFGYRLADIGGSTQTYNTFTNLHQGPRLVDFTTDMTSRNHQGLLFDRLFVSGFGFGGDPNNVSRLRVSKDKWYNFSAAFRRGVNVWDYSLLSNPLNPTTPFANAPAGFTPIIGYSPHRFETVRRSSDYDLSVLPQSRVTVRLGYSRNIMEGPSLSSFHQGTEVLAFQSVKNTMNAYRLGVDFKVLPRTNISYDQFWSYIKGDNGLREAGPLYALSNGTPVNIGIALNAGANQPCAGTFTLAGAVNPACNAFFSYGQHGRIRSSAPTEQVSMQSEYFQRLDLSARFSYTGTDLNVQDWSGNFAGRESRSNLRNAALFGPVSGRRVTATADAGATLHVTDKFSLRNAFRFSNFREPTAFDASSCQFFSSSLLVPANLFAASASLPAVCTPPADGAAGTPTHSTSSGPDVSRTISTVFLKQDEKTNLFEADYRFSSRFGARLGYRFRHRSIVFSDFESTTETYFPSNANRGDCALVAGALPTGCVDNGDGSFQFTSPASGFPAAAQTRIQEHSGVMGIWARPLSNWRINFDAELMSADNAFTRISPRQTQEYRLRSTYQPISRISLTGTMSIWEGRNNVSQINNLQHNRSYGLAASFEASSRFFLELGYDYNDVFSQILICYNSTTAPAGLAQCPGSTVLVQQVSTYANRSHFGYFSTAITPVRRLTMRLGANIAYANGAANLLSPNAPLGPLNSQYYLPFAAVEYQFAPRWTGKARWGYYGYHEDPSGVAQDLLVPRNFRGNLEMLSLRYAF